MKYFGSLLPLSGKQTRHDLLITTVLMCSEYDHI